MIRVLDYASNQKVQHFLSVIFQYDMIPTINKPTRIKRNTSTTINHIIINTVISGIQPRSLIIDISDHFPIVFALGTCEKYKPEDKAEFIYKQVYGEKQIELLEHEIGQIEWSSIIKSLDNPNTTYESLFNIFFETYDKYFPKVKIEIKAKAIQNPWITNGITKSSKKKQKFSEWFLKKRNPQNEQKYKNYNKLFEIYYSNKLLNCTGDINKNGILLNI